MKLKSSFLALILALGIICSGFSCTKSQKNLAVASDAIAHSLVNAKVAARQAVTQGVISQADETEFEEYLTKAAQAGLTLDQGIRANAAATTISAEVNSFLDAFNQLNTAGIAGIKNPGLQLTLSTIITGAESSVAIIAAAEGK